MQLVPSGYSTVLDAGARDGYYSKLLVNKFAHVTALDLHKPSIVHDRVHCLEGDITSLNFADRSFDVVLCSEVLEHVAGNPYGIYDDQTCIHCGSALVSPGPLSLPLRVCAATALRLAQLSSRLTRPHANLIHAVFESPVEKSRPPSEENRPFGPGPDSVD